MSRVFCLEIAEALRASFFCYENYSEYEFFLSQTPSESPNELPLQPSPDGSNYLVVRTAGTAYSNQKQAIRSWSNKKNQLVLRFFYVFY